MYLPILVVQYLFRIQFQPTAAGVAVVGDGQLNNVVGGGAHAQEDQAQAESTASEEETRNAPTGDTENVQVQINDNLNEPQEE